MNDGEKTVLIHQLSTSSIVYLKLCGTLTEVEWVS